MDQPQISPGWALLAIFILYGLAGALDQPIEDTEQPQPPTAMAPLVGVVRLQCQLEDVAASGDVQAKRRASDVGVVSLLTTERVHAAPHGGPQSPPTLRCLVIDE